MYCTYSGGLGRYENGSTNSKQRRWGVFREGAFPPSSPLFFTCYSLHHGTGYKLLYGSKLAVLYRNNHFVAIVIVLTLKCYRSVCKKNFSCVMVFIRVEILYNLWCLYHFPSMSGKLQFWQSSFTLQIQYEITRIKQRSKFEGLASTLISVQEWFCIINKNIWVSLIICITPARIINPYCTICGFMSC